MRGAKPYRIQEFLTAEGKSLFREWLDQLDLAVKVRIQARVLRFEAGNLGDHKSVGTGIYESRIDFGPGYRLYFGIVGTERILLLCGGVKGSQQRDIKRARDLWQDYRRRGRHGKARNGLE